MLKVESFNISNWSEALTGLIISENPQWVLIKNIKGDYSIDGYVLIKKEHIAKRETSIKEEKIQRVLSLKKESTLLPSWFVFMAPIQMLELVEYNLQLFSFQDTETEMFFGKVNEIKNDDSFYIDFITPDGEIIKKFDYLFRSDDIVTIEFESDYFEAIRLLWEDENFIIGEK